MKLIVGLGNPGKQYALTRHNIGFHMIDMICQNLKIDLSNNKFNGQYVKTVINDIDTIFLKPLTYMNLSGFCVNSFMQYFKIKSEDVLIIHDDIDLKFGQIQYKQNFSAAGHNGVRNIFTQTNLKNFQRLRIGVGKNLNFTTADWVLNNFTKSELLELKVKEEFICESVISWVNNNKFEDIMNNYNKK